MPLKRKATPATTQRPQKRVKKDMPRAAPSELPRRSSRIKGLARSKICREREATAPVVVVQSSRGAEDDDSNGAEGNGSRAVLPAEEVSVGAVQDGTEEAPGRCPAANRVEESDNGDHATAETENEAGHVDSDAPGNVDWPYLNYDDPRQGNSRHSTPSGSPASIVLPSTEVDESAAPLPPSSEAGSARARKAPPATNYEDAPESRTSYYKRRLRADNDLIIALHHLSRWQASNLHLDDLDAYLRQTINSATQAMDAYTALDVVDPEASATYNVCFHARAHLITFRTFDVPDLRRLMGESVNFAHGMVMRLSWERRQVFCGVRGHRRSGDLPASVAELERVLRTERKDAAARGLEGDLSVLGQVCRELEGEGGRLAEFVELCRRTGWRGARGARAEYGGARGRGSDAADDDDAVDCDAAADYDDGDDDAANHDDGDDAADHGDGERPDSGDDENGRDPSDDQQDPASSAASSAGSANSHHDDPHDDDAQDEDNQAEDNQNHDETEDEESRASPSPTPHFMQMPAQFQRRFITLYDRYAGDVRGHFTVENVLAAMLRRHAEFVAAREGAFAAAMWGELQEAADAAGVRGFDVSGYRSRVEVVSGVW